MRQLEFEERQRVVAQRLRKIGSERAIIAALDGELRSMNEASRQMLAVGQVNVDGVCRYRYRAGYLREQVGSAEMRILQHERELKIERAAMVKASVAVKALEKLKERRLAAHLLQMKHLEAVEQDETALQLHRRKMEDSTGTELGCV